MTENTKLAINRVGLRKLVHSYTKYQFDAAIAVFYNDKQWRLSFICDLKDENTAPKRYTYVFGNETENYRTAAQQLIKLYDTKPTFESIKEAFSVEKLSKDFFAGYKKQYDKFVGSIGDNKPNRDYVKKMMGRLVFLQFLQKKGWMSVPADRNDWSGGDMQYTQNLVARYKGDDKLLTNVLEVLFFDTLNTKRGGDIADPKLGDNIKIPYLNGGLFDKDTLDHKDIDFPYDYFAELVEFFSHYNFTIDENDPYDSEVGIDPEMLGHIFENLLEDNKDKGAFYTPKEIVQYMCRQSLIEYLQSKLEKHPDIEAFVNRHDVSSKYIIKNARAIEEHLDNVKICDPAIGSGAFPMGILNEIFHCKMALDLTLDRAETKKSIIQNSIYGVDIEQGAVDIARLRFWLSLEVDESEPQPLPNLDYKIMCGNSLLSRHALDVPINEVFAEYNKGKKKEDQFTLESYKALVSEYTSNSNKEEKATFRTKIEEIKRAFKTELSKTAIKDLATTRGKIFNIENSQQLFGDNKLSKEQKDEIKELKAKLKAKEQANAGIENNQLYADAFEWRFEFPALLNDNGEFVGFDIVIGNPPYVNIANIKPDTYRNILKDRYYSAKNKSDLYAFFVEQGFMLLANGSILSYIIPHTWKATDSFLNLREIIFKQNVLIEIVNLEMGVFGAIVKPLIAIFKKECTNNYQVKISNDKFEVESVIDSAEIIEHPFLALDTTSSLMDKKLYNKIEKDSIALSSIIEFSRGIKTSNDKRFILSENINDDCKRIFRGKNIKAYSLNWNNEYLWYRPDLMREKVGCVPYTASFFETPEKLISQRVNSSSQLLVAYDNSQNYFLDTTNVSKYSTWDGKTSLKFLCGLLNSKLINFWYCNKYKMPTIGIYELHSIPIKIAKDQQPYIDLVDQILEQKRENPQADTSALEAEIDQMVYALYNLTPEEITLIENK